MSTQLWIDIIGWLGAGSVLLAYLMVSLQKWKGDSPRYQGFNLLGGLCLIANTLYFGAYPSSLVNLVWVGIAIYSLARGASGKRKRSVSPDSSG
jgi:formate hydrogenlyase subunit 3/multisubunit Na+/H+ antiporter MnhD subunit